MSSNANPDQSPMTLLQARFFNLQVSMSKTRALLFFLLELLFVMLISVFFFFTAISQAFLTTCDVARKERYPVFSCEHCPMYWYNKLCQEIEGNLNYIL